MKLTVVYDNEVKREGLWRGYGFSCFIEAENMPSILFDTGGDSATLLHNMKELNIDPKDIGIIVISHAHGDHTEGLFGILVVTGCSHPGVANILKAASKFGKLYGILGGFHGFREFKALEGLSLIYPCRCTAYKREIKHLYPDRAVACGAGLVVEL
jgi:metal-dependent hydrolase (beta-lactamase superfamily II)